MQQPRSQKSSTPHRTSARLACIQQPTAMRILLLPRFREAPSTCLDPDAALVTRAASGEAVAFGALMSRHRERVLNLAFSLLGERSDAEDAAQEAFVRAFENLGRFRGESQFATWLYRIAVNVCLARLRASRAPETFEEHAQALESDDEPCGPLNDDPARQLESRELVMSALQKLTPRLRAALVLREMHGLSYDEIALALEIPSGTVRSRLSEARRLFRAAWLEAGGAE